MTRNRGRDSTADLTKAVNSNTDATKQNSSVMAGIGAPGSYGNITRQGVTGDGMNGYSINKAAEAGGYALSAI